MSEDNLGDVRYFIDHDNRILYMGRYDDLTKKGIYAEWETMQQLDGFDASYDSVVDYSFVPCIDITSAEIIKLNSEMSNYDVRTGNIALISGLKQGRFLLAQFFCKIANLIGSRKHQVFHSKAEAELWLYSLRK